MLKKRTRPLSHKTPRHLPTLLWCVGLLSAAACTEAPEDSADQPALQTTSASLGAGITYACENSGSCVTTNDCCDDQYCSFGVCVPNDGDVPPTTCVDNTTFTFDPTVYCEWDPRPNNENNNVYTTPLVVELATLGAVATRELVFTTWENASVSGDTRRIGTMRVIATHDPTPGQNGASPQCQQLDQVGLESVAGYTNLQLRPAYGAQLAAGDLNQDNKPEIVGLFSRGNGSLANDRTFLSAIEFNTVNGVMSHNRLWVGRVCDGDPNTLDLPVSAGINRTNAGPTLYDLGADARPEIIWERHIFDADGCLRSGTNNCQVVTNNGLQYWQCDAQLPAGNYNDLGVFNVVEDIDNDGRLELVNADQVYELAMAPGVMVWQIEQNWSPQFWGPQAPLNPGLVAIADMTSYNVFSADLSVSNNGPIATPEIVSVTTGTSKFGRVNILSNQGKLLWERELVRCDGANANNDNKGGPPTIADFDGDGYPEIGVAGACYYAVYDPDCGGTTIQGWQTNFRGPGVSGTCNLGAGGGNGAAFGPGVLWAVPVTDRSSNATGSTVFDFDADGRAEVVYRDECQLWVLDGRNGQLKPSPNAFDYIASNNTGYEYPTVADVVSEPPPNAGANYTGPTAAEIVIPRGRDGASACNALYNPFTRKGGIIVVQQRDHAWAPTLPHWHQHTYAITNYLAGKILSKADGSWLKNWLINGLNNFRTNPVLSYPNTGTPDLTSRLTVADSNGICENTKEELTGEVCNRGAVTANLSANGGMPVVFQDRQTGPWRTLRCNGSNAYVVNESTDSSLTLTGTLAPGQCVPVSCPVSGYPLNIAELRLVIDPPVGAAGQGNIPECFESNNASFSPCLGPDLGGGGTAINGACGSAAGGSTMSKPTSGLCASGNASSVSGSGPYSWTCSGSGGGSNASCSSNRSCASTSANWAQSGLTCAATLPSGNHGANATASDTTAPNTGNRTYTCNQGSWSATNAGTCRSSVINGACGTAAGGSTLSAPTSGLCASGTASSVSGSGPYSWTCQGSGGGSNASCSSNRSCGSQLVTWYVSGNQCVGGLNNLGHGQSATATDSTAPATGQRTFMCNQGTLSATNAGTCGGRIRPIGCLSIGYEICDNGVDDDCNGFVDDQPCLSRGF